MKPTVAIRVSTQIPVDALLPAPLGSAAARPVPRLTVTSATAAQVRGASRRCQTQLDSSRVSGSSTMKIGWTRAIGPVASAPACSSEATMTMAMPASQTRRRARSRISDNPPSCLVALVWEAARRCSTDAVALLAAVSNASTIEITA